MVKGVIYINYRGPYGVETIDEVRAENFPTYRAFRREVQRILGEYSMIMPNVYTSPRSTREWRAK